MASCTGCPRWTRFSAACLSWRGTTSLLFTRMQSSCTAICDHNGFLLGPISSNPCLTPLSMTRLRRSIHVSSEVNFARRLLSNNLDRLSSESSICCFCSYCSFCLLDLWCGSIAHTSLSLSMSSVFVRSTSITWISLNFRSFGSADRMLIGTWSVFSGTLSVSSDVATSSRLMFRVVFDSPPINCQNESACCPPLFVGPVAIAIWLLIESLFRYPSRVFLRPPRSIFLVRCSVSVTSSSSDNSFGFDSEWLNFESRMLSSLSSFLHSCGVSDHQSYERLKFSDISFFESVFFLNFVDWLLNCFCSFLTRLFAGFKWRKSDLLSLWVAV